MNSAIASNINGGTLINQQVANGSHTSLLLSSIDFSLTETKTNFTPTLNQGKYLIKLSGKEEIFNGQHKSSDCDRNKNPVEPIVLNGNKEKTPEDTIPVPKYYLYTGKIQVEWDQVHKIGAGLHNLGNTCFMNTVIQCLTYCPPLANYLLSDNDHSSKCSVVGFCMMCVLQKHIKRAISNSGNVIKPVDVHNRLKLIAKHFQYGRQEDAHEFLRYVIDNLWKSCLPQTNGVNKLDPASKETTIVNRIFGGYHRSQVTCLSCKKESNTFDHFMDFILDIKQNVVTLEKALEKFTQPELLDQENCYKCIRCKMKVQAQKRFSVYRAPTVATFQLKRFDYNRQFGGKITKYITYPEKLNLRPYMAEKGEPVWYRLNAIIVHSGPSCNAGHYYCYVKNSNGLWYIMDDNRVFQVSLNQVLNQCAYVLFYIKVPTGEKAPFKKHIDNKNPYFKGVISNNHFEKSSNTNILKSSPLSEKLPFANSNHIIGSPTIAKKFNTSSMPSREKVSFGFRPGLSPSAYTPKNSSKSSLPDSVSKSQGGLVPYNEDSSGSSNVGESMNSSLDKSKSGSEGRLGLNTKTSLLEDYSNSPRLEVKKKSSFVYHNPSNSLIRDVPKVNGNWVVTKDVSDAVSSCSNTSVSNSDWKVTAIDDDSPNKDFDLNQQPPETIRSVLEEPKSNILVEKIEENQSHGGVCENDRLFSQKCDFRKQQNNFKPHFSQNAETSPVKRKHNSSYSEIFESAVSNHYENRHSSSPKKTKYSEKFSLLANENSVKKPCLDLNNMAAVSPQKNFSVFNDESSNRTQMNGVTSSSQKSGLCTDRRTSTGSNHSPEKKTSHSPEGESLSPKVPYKERNGYKDMKSSQNDHYNRKGPILNHAKNNSLYGTEVPTWRSEKHYRPSIVPSYDRRRNFDDYDDEFDRGKVRKPKIKHEFKYFKSKHSFKNHADKYYDKKYNGYNDDFHYKYRNSYGSHNWKSKHHNKNYNRYKSHHRRY